jgi:hypothetical protein
MQWSKLKKSVEAHFAPAVAGRVELRSTSYRHVHDGEGRGWITIDKEEVHDFSTLKYFVERNNLAGGIRKANRAEDWMDPEQRAQYFEAGEAADEILEKKGVVSKGWYEWSLREYLELTVEDALASDNFIHRGLAVLDRRLGKRRLKEIELPPTEHPLVQRLLAFRRQAEGLAVRLIAPAPPTSP